MNINDIKDPSDCPISTVLALQDCLHVLSGKWKLPIIGSLLFGKKRFKDMEESIGKITPRMLSKELKELELNNVVKRNIYDTRPVRIEYELTESGKLLAPIIHSMVKWGITHRHVSIGSLENSNAIEKKIQTNVNASA